MNIILLLFGTFLKESSHTYYFEISVVGVKRVEIVSVSAASYEQARESVFSTLQNKYSNATFAVISWRKYR